MLVVFFAAILFVGTLSIGLRVLTDGRRQKEQEMIWRGKQYTRAIKLYYRKLGRFPNTVDDLAKPKIGNVRFLRQAYTDPMNKQDGSWRMIYVGPAGQLIGSLNPANSSPLGAGAAIPGSGTASSFGFGSSSGFGATSTAPGTQSTGFGFGTGTGTNTQAPNPTGGVGIASGTGTGATGTSTTNGTGTDSQSIPMGDTPTIVGGNIIGIGSKINHSSIIVYEQATNYRLFEFIWNPSKDLGIAPGATPGGATGQGAQGAPGTPGQFGAPGFGTPGQGQPGQPGQPGFPANPNAPQQPNQPPTSDPNSNPNPNPNQQQP